MSIPFVDAPHVMRRPARPFPLLDFYFSRNVGLRLGRWAATFPDARHQSRDFSATEFGTRRVRATIPACGNSYEIYRFNDE